MEDIKYSVIFPVYNVEKYLERSLNSVLNQDYSNVEIILVNDGSTDKSGEICSKFERNFDNVVAIHQKNQGSGIARQKALDYCTGDYICFYDPDDYVNSGVFKLNYKIIKDYKPDIIFNGYDEVRKDFKGKTYLKKNRYRFSKLYVKDEIFDNFEHISSLSIRSLWNKFYSREFLEKNNVKFTDQKVGQDALFNFDLYKYVESIYVSTNSFYNYDSTIENSSVKKYRPNRLLYELRIFNKFKNIFVFRGLDGEYSQLIYNNLWLVYFYSIVNMTAENCPCTLKEKIRFQSKMRNHRMFREIFSQDILRSDLNILFKSVYLFEKLKLYPLSLAVINVYYKLYLKIK